MTLLLPYYYLIVLYDIARLTKPHSQQTFVELIWKLVPLNCKSQSDPAVCGIRLSFDPTTAGSD